jgi:hypothetical protein
MFGWLGMWTCVAYDAYLDSKEAGFDLIRKRRQIGKWPN